MAAGPATGAASGDVGEPCNSCGSEDVTLTEGNRYVCSATLE